MGIKISTDTFFFLIDLYWNIIASQYRVSFCCTTKQISHMHTHVPYPLPLEPPSHPPYPTPLGHHKAPSRSPCAMLLLPTSQLFYIRQGIYVNATLTSPQVRPPTPGHQVHSLCLPLYSCPATRFISTIFFLFHIYVLAYGICFSLSDLLHSI